MIYSPKTPSAKTYLPLAFTSSWSVNPIRTKPSMRRWQPLKRLGICRAFPFAPGTDVPCGNRANLLKYKENLENCCGYKYLFDSLEKTISDLG
jgi:hypothetical protein